MIKRTDYLTRSFGSPNGCGLAEYEQGGGYRAARRALGTPREILVAEVKKAHLRGRGGAGFDCGLKWSFMPPEDGGPRYLVVNGDEGEPGTFKDRAIMEQNPHAVVEGAIIAAHAIGASTVYVYVRDELHRAKARDRKSVV